MINKEVFEKCSVKENLDFIKKVLDLATHNSFTKDDLLLLIKWQNAIIEKMKRCVNCKYYEPGNRADNDCSQCSIMFCQCQLDKHWCEAHDEGCKFWELAE